MTGTKKIYKKVKKIQLISRYHILYIDDKWKVIYNRGKLDFIYYDKIIYKHDLYQTLIYRLLSQFNILSRLFRLEPRYVDKVTTEKFIVSNSGYLYNINPIKKISDTICKYNIGTRNPLYFCRFIRKEKMQIVFGDYGGHNSAGGISIYLYKDNSVKEIAYFEKKQIGHIHRVEYDSIRDCFWIFTGDTDAESGIWKLNYGDKKIIPYLTGKQLYRICVAFIKEDNILYATDSPDKENYICILNLNNKKIRKLYKLPGPCIYAIKENKKNGDIFFSTSVEPDSTLQTIRYRLTYIRGKGIMDTYSYIVFGNEKKGFAKLCRAKKDSWPMWLFQFGNHKFPVQNIADKILFYRQSCKGHKGTFQYNKCEIDE